MIRIKRVYDPATPEDGRRLLVDRLWPRGVSREGALIDEWLKEIAPSDSLRKWFGHDPERWEEFRRRYLEELRGKREILRTLATSAREGTVSLLYAAKDTEHNNAVVLRDLLATTTGDDSEQKG